MSTKFTDFTNNAAVVTVPLPAFAEIPVVVAGTIFRLPATLLGTAITGALGYTPLNPANNLSDVQSASSSVQNLFGVPVTFAGSFSAPGASSIILSAIGPTSLSLPTSGTIVTTDGAQTLTNKSINAAQLTGTVNRAQLPTFTSSVSGIVPVSGGGTANFLRADGSFMPISGAAGGTVTNVAVNAPLTGGPISSAGTLNVSTFAGSSPGVVPTSGGGSTNFLRADGTFAPPVVATTPTIQRFLSSSGTYVTPANVKWISVRMVGAGGGAGGNGSSGVTGGAAGGTTSFSAGLIAGPGGGSAANSDVPGVGGTATGGNVTSLNGASGARGNAVLASIAGAQGGVSPFGGAGTGGTDTGGAGGNAVLNSGSGGGGTGGSAGTSATGGGGAGAYIEHIFAPPSVSYSYVVGNGGAGGNGGSGGSGGGNGGSGQIVVIERYNY